MTMSTTPCNEAKGKDRVSIFQYSGSDHCFSFDHLPENASEEWKNDHDKWLQQTCTCARTDDHDDRCHQPSFRSLQELQSFNTTGRELSQRLEEEFPSLDVEPFEPVYDQLRVSCGWWHLRDEKYGFPVSIQRLPVSDALKADFSLWRYKKDENCLIDAEELEKEGQELQKRLYDELHQNDADEAEEDMTRSFHEVEETTTSKSERVSW